ncbi:MULTISPECIES: GNAT family N-acetyltransferase [unclassified Gilliamella]|uniref:GNAT family N-acetyltransferase n=1 Tax=unclassified Gilliamella TaxID=2685620 RepID=UPI002269D6E2|nr:MULTISPECIES: GNAT family N-acetyltransferase [unclassified Gilliamella]MCX8642196.1 GNAT family N-acetyltransferase [Gilliamella sp. B3835]MCX8707382.1 GNAT family N-acetyltransferase [Gilliamella sp. B3783]MCX8710709.1 GNAT family N-acetyltransferase [Gilliamella sp. B3780]MCX8715271.1 GNAT family N-acetyltransferase [Gilliamella sp. B3781]MCX8716364.1 GNAT family N-acetyltransferase [Gilliamella sp. B3784]
MTNIIYRCNIKPTLTQAITLYNNCSLGERRPIDDHKRFQAMLDNANLIITAWDKDTLVGIARCLTDFVYITYLADLAVDNRYQKQGIGKQLIKEVQNYTGLDCAITLLAAPQAVEYYGHIGFNCHPSAWIIKEELK